MRQKKKTETIILRCSKREKDKILKNAGDNSITNYMITCALERPVLESKVSDKSELFRHSLEVELADALSVIYHTAQNRKDGGILSESLRKEFDRIEQLKKKMQEE